MTTNEIVKKLLNNAIKDRDALRMDRGNCKHIEAKEAILALMWRYDKTILEYEEIINLQKLGL